MTYESKQQWDTDINSVGGAKDVLLVSSPFSDKPSANASQGALTYGNLTQEFEPPQIMISASDDGYYVRNRIDKNIVNAPKEQDAPEAFTGKSYVAPSRRSEKFTVNPSRRKEKYTEMPGFRGSEIHQEAFTQEETNYLFIVCMCVIAFCIVGVCFGLLIPRFRVCLFNEQPYQRMW